jgi:hydroxyacylglutathione hydrolase
MSAPASTVPVVTPIETAALGDRSYLAHDGTTALVIDPQRDIDRVLALAGRLGVTITHVFESHLHNDYVSGGLALARLTGAAYHVNADDPVQFDRIGVRDGDVIDVGPALRVGVIATPGHTFTHLSYALEADGKRTAVFTGGSLLYGSTGRPDLLGAEHTDRLARAQFASAHRLAAELPSEAAIYPTHGFGSFCSATQVQDLSSTIGRESLTNPVLTSSENEYVRQLLAGLDAYPAYYAHMGPANAAGPAGPDLSAPRRATPGELRQRVEAGEWVVDLRDRTAFAAGHMTGTLSFSLHDSLATYLGWLIPWSAPVTLLAETPQEIAAAQRELVRIGLDRPAGGTTGDPADWAAGAPLRSYPVTSFAALAAALGSAGRPPTVLDVRLPLERAESHLRGSIHIPLHQLPTRLAELPDNEIWVHCQSGLRAGIAASLLDADHRPVVLVDDDMEHAGAAGLPLERSASTANGSHTMRPATRSSAASDPATASRII